MSPDDFIEYRVRLTPKQVEDNIAWIRRLDRNDYSKPLTLKLSAKNLWPEEHGLKSNNTFIISRRMAAKLIFLSIEGNSALINININKIDGEIMATFTLNTINDVEYMTESTLTQTN